MRNHIFQISFSENPALKPSIKAQNLQYNFWMENDLPHLPKGKFPKIHPSLWNIIIS